MKIGITGYGFVGQATHAIFNPEVEVSIYDIKEKYNSSSALENIFNSNIIFVCLPTPMAESKAQDSSTIINFLNECVKNKYTGIIVIKSTVLFRHIEPFISILKIVLNPEFLNQNTYIKDSLNQKTILLGGEIVDIKKVQNLYLNYTLLTDISFEVLPHKEAIDFKYTRNLYNAYKVLFWEFIQDTTGNSRLMSELFKKFPQNEMCQVGMDGFRGFGGSCLLKDTYAWDKEFNHNLTEFMLKYNLYLLDNINK